MVTTASASLQASAADLAFLLPCWTARSRASALRSKARTSWPALARLAAMPPPMLPSPMNATRAILSTFPIPRPLLDEGGHAFLLVLGAEQAMEQPALETDALGQAHLERGIDHFLGGDGGERGHAGDRLGGLQRFVEQVGGRDDTGDE